MSMSSWSDAEGDSSRYPLNSADLVGEHMERISGKSGYSDRKSEEILDVMEELDWTPQAAASDDEADVGFSNAYEEEEDTTYDEPAPEEERASTPRSSFSSIGNKFKGAKATVQRAPQSFVPAASGMVKGARRSLGRGVAKVTGGFKGIPGTKGSVPTKGKKEDLSQARSKLKKATGGTPTTGPKHFNKPPPGTLAGAGNRDRGRSVSEMAGMFDKSHNLNRAKAKPVLKDGERQVALKPTLKIKKAWNPRQKWGDKAAGAAGNWAAKP